MNPPPTSAVELLALSDPEFFAIDESRESALRLKFAEMFVPDPLSGRGPDDNVGPGLFVALGAPRQVDLAAQSDIPILLGTMETGLRRWEVKDDLNTRIFCLDLDSGRLHSEILFVRPKRMLTADPSMEGPPPDAINRAVILSNVRIRPGLRDLLEIDWQPARLAFGVISYDLASNVVKVELHREGASPRESTFREPSSFVRPAGGETTARPGSPGLSLVVSSAVGSTGELPVEIRVSQPRKQTVLVPSAAKPDQELLCLSLLFVRRDEEYPAQIDLAVPVQLREEAGQDMVQTSFRLDARAALPGVDLSGQNQVYLISGGVIVGPYPCQVSDH